MIILNLMILITQTKVRIMKELIMIFTICLSFLLVSYKVHLKLLKVNWLWFSALSICYFSFTYLFFECINYIHSYLRLHEIYIEFGHASILLIGLMLICLFIATINVMVAFIKNIKKSNFSLL